MKFIRHHSAGNIKYSNIQIIQHTIENVQLKDIVKKNVSTQNKTIAHRYIITIIY